MLGWSAADRRLRPVPDGNHPLDVADSWLVADGLVRGLPYHAERFVESCRRRHGVAPAETIGFLRAACRQSPRTGRWFPRVEFAAGAVPGGPAVFRLRLRAAPQSSSGVVLRCADRPDSRTDPTVKGPDLEMLIGLRQAAVPLGADEVLLVSGSGTVLEGALSAVLWWRDGVLCVPPLSLPVLPSVTRRLLLQIAAEVGTELWTASALHGIRPVTSWSGAGLTAAPARRVAWWQARLAEKAIPVTEAVKRLDRAHQPFLMGKNPDQIPAAG